MMATVLADVLDLAGTLFLVRFHWFWMAVALGLGAWVGWRTGAEAPPPSPPGDPP